MNRRSAISAINKAGLLLVFPIENRKEPASIWTHFFPRKDMRWEWDESGDSGVADLWHLRAELSTCKQVVYTKWFRGRATYFSRPLFVAMLRALNPSLAPETLSSDARKVLETLEGESPLSTKQLKRAVDLTGRANERAYERALEELWSRLLIVAFGEVDEGAFPSLAVGSTKVLFEDLWSEAFGIARTEAERKVATLLPSESLFYKHYEKLRARTPEKPSRDAPRAPGARSPAKVVKFEDL